ncbi:MAG: hypothetical protein AB8B50_05325 [Pirellulaceae bacterium]
MTKIRLLLPHPFPALLKCIAIACLALPTFANTRVAQAQEFSGVWKGKWTADANKRWPEHGGSLRIRLKPSSPGTYQGLFSGRFALVIPYFYRADVKQYGNTLVSSRKLGPMGSYNMRLGASHPQHLTGRWNAGSSRGSIRVRRVR